MIADPGEEELHTFIKNVKNPLFPSFISKYEEHIAEWSLRLHASNSRELHMIWSSRFNDAVRETRTDIRLKKSKLILSKWDKFYEELLALREMKQTSRIEGQKLINKSMTNASARSSRLLENTNAEGSSKSVVVDVERMSNNEAENEDAEGENDFDEAEDKIKPVVDRLYMLYYKKFQNEAFDEEDDAFLVDVMNNKSCIQEKLFSHASKLLLKKSLGVGEEIMLKLTLSSIVNMIQPESYETLNSILSQEEMKVLESSSNNTYTGLLEVDMTLLRRVLESGGEEIDLEAIEEEILRERLRLRSLKMKSSDQYKMLDILRCM